MKTTASHDPTVEIVARARSGDRAAFDELVLRFQSRLRSRIASRMNPLLRAHVAPEDIVQEVFVVAFETIRRFTWRGERSFYRWLETIAEHLIWSASQKRECTEISLTLDVSGRDTTPSAHLRREERFDRLERALESLTEQHREVINLARLEGLKIKEIATRMNRSPGAVKKLLARALLSLKESFGETESLQLPDRRLALSNEANSIDE